MNRLAVSMMAALVLTGLVAATRDSKPVAPLTLASKPLAPLTLAWQNNILTIRGNEIPGGEIKVWYLEAYCRAGSTDRDWGETVIKHQTKAIASDGAEPSIRLRCELADGVIAEHVITAGNDEVDFRIRMHNPTNQPSAVHWAQPCIRVDKFVGVKPDRASEAYLSKSFIFVDGKPQRMPTQPWATKARYVPGQVWCPTHVDRNDVNPRPLSAIVPSNGLIGCFSADEKRILATAWEPYQELFQGVIVCLHSDFRVGGLAAGETKRIRGKLYLVDGDLPALVSRYQRDFPEHRTP